MKFEKSYVNFEKINKSITGIRAKNNKKITEIRIRADVRAKLVKGFAESAVKISNLENNFAGLERTL